MVDYEIQTNSGCLIQVSDYCFRFLKKTTEISTPESLSAFHEGETFFDSDSYYDDEDYEGYGSRTQRLQDHLETGYAKVTYSVPFVNTAITNFLCKLVEEVSWFKEVTTFDPSTMEVSVIAAPGDQMFQVLNTFRNFSYIFHGNFSEFLDAFSDKFSVTEIFNLWKVCTFSKTVYDKKFRANLSDADNDYCWAACSHTDLSQLEVMLFSDPVWKQEIGVLDDGAYSLCACYEVPSVPTSQGRASHLPSTQLADFLFDRIEKGR